jgi:hypothetical protein
MKRNLWLLLLLFLAIAVTAGIMRSRAVSFGLGTVPEIVSFTATPPVIEPGQTVTLAWNAHGAPSLTMNRGTENDPSDTLPERTGLPASGTITVQPKKDTVYTLTCETADGPMCATSVTVRTK